MRKRPPRSGGALRDESGTAAVEFAIILPVLLLALTGVIEVGRALWMRASVQYACEEAARYAITHPSATMAALAAQASAALTVPLHGATFSATTSAAGGLTYVTVRGTVLFQPVVPLPGMSEIVLDASSKVPL